MSATNKIKWLGSIILAGALLVLAMMGGTWGTTYTVDASVNAEPYIESIDPAGVYAGSPNRLIIISGTDYGNLNNTGVRLLGDTSDSLLYPLESISPLQIKVLIPSELLVEPTLYILTVIKSLTEYPPTIPTVPDPPEEEISNPVPFTVYVGQFNYLPFISR